MERGSILIITLIAVLILSFMVASGIRTATTEIHTAQNHYLNKIAYYNAVDAVKVVAPEPASSPGSHASPEEVPEVTPHAAHAASTALTHDELRSWAAEIHAARAPA